MSLNELEKERLQQKLDGGLEDPDGPFLAEAMGLTEPEEERDLFLIEGEILFYKRQAGGAFLEIGKRLNEAKRQLSHGEWLPWLREKVDISERSAQDLMRLAREYSKSAEIADLGASKALALLGLPASEREQFAAEKHAVDGVEKSVSEMTAKELKQAIRERDEALKAAQAAKADAATAEEARAKMAEDMAMVNASLEDARQERERADDQVRQLEAELEVLKARPVDVAVETMVDQEAVEKARADAVAEMQGKLDRAKAAKEKAEARQKTAEASLAEVRRRLEAAEKADKRAALSADKDLAMFEVLFTQGQDLANKLHGLLIKARGREDQATAQGMEKALRALAEAIGRCAE